MDDLARKRGMRSAAEARRDQLLEIGRRIIETEGVEALRPTRVAELAGCTRPLIYQYFPRREDIFIAITEELYAVVDAEPSRPGEIVHQAVQDNTGPALEVMDRLWDHLDRRGPAALILRSTPEISSEFRVYLDQMRESYERRWLQGLLDFGVDPAAGELILEMFVTTMKVLALQYLSGRIDRTTAIERHLAIVGGLFENARRASGLEEASGHDARSA